MALMLNVFQLSPSLPKWHVSPMPRKIKKNLELSFETETLGYLPSPLNRYRYDVFHEYIQMPNRNPILRKSSFCHYLSESCRNIRFSIQFTFLRNILPKVTQCKCNSSLLHNIEGFLNTNEFICYA